MARWSKGNIKSERVSLMEEYVERNEFDGFFKREIGQANDVKEEYVEYESSNAIKTEADESLIKKEFAKKSFVETFSTDCVRTAKRDKAKDQTEANEATYCGEIKHAAVNLSSENHPPRNICQHCEREFDDASILERHLTTHHNTKYHKCSLCGEDFRRKGSLDIHLQEHHQDEISKCDKCDQIFSDMTDLNSHMDKMHHRKTEKEKVKDTMPHFTEMMLLPWKCKECGEEFTTEKSLKMHIHVVHKGGVNPNSCKLCDFIGKDAHKLKFHMLREHSLSEPPKFKCKHCEHTCVHSSELKIHMYYHVKFVYKCEHCHEISFTKKQEHKLHMLRHGEPYTCKRLLCNKSFATHKNLEQHLLIHEKDLLHNCKQCDKTFNIFSDLKRHIVKVHKQTFEDSTDGIGLKLDTV